MNLLIMEWLPYQTLKKKTNIIACLLVINKKKQNQIKFEHMSITTVLRLLSQREIM